MESWSFIRAGGLAGLLLAASAASGWGAQTESVPGDPEASDPEAILRRADLALGGVETLRTEFIQRVENPVLEKTTVGSGVLAYKAPDRFRIAYSDPAGDLVLNDGTHVWIYLPSTQPGQVIRQLATHSGVRNPLMYLRDLRGGYAVRYAGVEAVAGRAADHIVLAPLDRGAPFTRIEAWVERASGLLRQVRTEADDGVRTTYTFRTLERDAALDASLFQFRVPRGAEVFDQ